MNKLKINGEDKVFDGDLPSTLAALLEHLGVDAATVVAEIDGQIVERAKFSLTPLKASQSIELVRFVGGG
jgi:thiamine biosynthesis protein ThiS